jgi:hypothetical protein
LDELVQRATAGQAKTELIEFAVRSGIGPEVYDADTRKGAHLEFCQFVSRLLSLEIEEPIISKDDALAFLRKATKALRAKAEPYYEAWEKLTERWIDVLQNKQ